MRKLFALYLSFILCLSLSFALQVTITADFNNTKNVARLGTLDWFIEPVNSEAAINVTSYCTEGEAASEITIPQKQFDGQPGTVRKTCTVTNTELLKQYSPFYTYATFSYMQPETIDGSPKIVYYTFPTPKSKMFGFNNYIEDAVSKSFDWLASIFVVKKTCDKDSSVCTVGDFCYLTDSATSDMNTVDKMTQRLNDDPTLKARVDQAFLIIDESPDGQKLGCLPVSTKELFGKLGTKGVISSCSQKCGGPGADKCGDGVACGLGYRCNTTSKRILSDDCECVEDWTCFQENMELSLVDPSTGKDIVEGAAGPRKIGLKIKANFYSEPQFDNWSLCRVWWQCNKEDVGKDIYNNPDTCCPDGTCDTELSMWGSWWISDSASRVDLKELGAISGEGYVATHEYGVSESGDKYIYVLCNGPGWYSASRSVDFTTSLSGYIKYTIDDCTGKPQDDCTPANGCAWSATVGCYKDTTLRIKSAGLTDAEVEKLWNQPLKIRFEAEDPEALVFKSVTANVEIWKTDWKKNPDTGKYLADTKITPFEYSDDPKDSIRYLEITADGYLMCKISFSISRLINPCGKGSRDTCNPPQWSISPDILEGDCVVDKNYVVVSNVADTPIKQGFDETGVVKVKLKREEKLATLSVGSDCGGACNDGRCPNYAVCALNEDTKEFGCKEADTCKYLKAELSYLIDASNGFRISASLSNNSDYRGQACNNGALSAAFGVFNESGGPIKSKAGKDYTLFYVDYKSIKSGQTLTYTSQDTWNLAELCKGRDNFTYALFTGCGVTLSDDPGENWFRKEYDCTGKTRTEEKLVVQSAKPTPEQVCEKVRETYADVKIRGDSAGFAYQLSYDMLEGFYPMRYNLHYTGDDLKKDCIENRCNLEGANKRTFVRVCEDCPTTCSGYAKFNLDSPAGDRPLQDETMALCSKNPCDLPGGCHYEVEGGLGCMPGPSTCGGGCGIDTPLGKIGSIKIGEMLELSNVNCPGDKRCYGVECRYDPSCCGGKYAENSCSGKSCNYNEKCVSGTGACRCDGKNFCKDYEITKCSDYEGKDIEWGSKGFETFENYCTNNPCGIAGGCQYLRGLGTCSPKSEQILTIKSVEDDENYPEVQNPKIISNGTEDLGNGMFRVWADVNVNMPCNEFEHADTGSTTTDKVSWCGADLLFRPRMGQTKEFITVQKSGIYYSEPYNYADFCGEGKNPEYSIEYNYASDTGSDFMGMVKGNVNCELKEKLSTLSVDCKFTNSLLGTHEIKNGNTAVGDSQHAPGYDYLGWRVAYSMVYKCNDGNMEPYACSYSGISPGSTGFMPFGQSVLFDYEECPWWGGGYVGCQKIWYRAYCSTKGISIEKVKS